jgi:diacylglycerol O-acyltransferase
MLPRFLRPSDAFVWSIEADARLRSSIVTLTMLDRAPDWDVTVERFATLADIVPQFRSRISASPWPVPPRWEEDPDFDLTFHLRRAAAHRPATMETLLEIARVEAMADFDRARPPWTATLIENTADGGAALLCKLHHSISDGVGAVALATALFDGTDALARSASDAPHENLLTALTLMPFRVAGGLVHPARTLTTALSTAASVARTARPVTSSESSIPRVRTKSRRVGTHEVCKTTLRQAGHIAGGSLNDAFLAAVAGGVRRYAECHGHVMHQALLMMPISIRTPSDPAGGNRATLMRFAIPVGISDPGERIRALHAVTSQVRHEKSLDWTDLVAVGLSLAPRRYVASVLYNVDLVASDVPGLPTPVTLGGAVMTAQYAFAPTIGAAFNVTMLSYVDTCSIGINVDSGAISDFEVFRECLVAGFAEVLAVAEAAPA